MPRRPRVAPGGLVYHCFNRAVARLALFETDEDYTAFERVLEEAARQHPTRILAYCVLPNHWHIVLWPRRDGELTDFVRWLTHTHTMRCHAHFRTSGSGHLYQGRFKAFPVQTDDHFYSVVRYVERNALRTGLVSRAQEWRWSSLWRRRSGNDQAKSLLHAWPLPEPSRWIGRKRNPSERPCAHPSTAVRRSGRPSGTPAPQNGSAWSERYEPAAGPESRSNKTNKEQRPR
jgi:putative transposase